MDIGEREEYISKIKETQQQYYEKHQKNLIFKNAQKLDCAHFVSQNADVQKMIQCTAFIVPNTNILYYNYLVFKTFANDSTYLSLHEYVTSLIAQILQTYETFEFHINMKTFSVTACQRYYSLITSSIDDNLIFTERMSKIVVYHTPFIIDQITKILYNSVRTFIHKVEYVRENSDERIAQLFNLDTK